MGSGASVAAAGGVKVVVAGAVATVGVVKLGVGTVSTDGELMQDGLEDLQAGAAELLRGSATVVTTTTAVALATAAGGLARMAEGGPRKAVEGVIDAPIAALDAAKVSGPLGAVAGAFLTAHGRDGSWQRRKERLTADALIDREVVLEEVAMLAVRPCESTAFLWELAEAALACYDTEGGDISSFRRDLSGIRDPEEEVEAQLTVFLRRRHGDGPDLAVLAIRGTQDVHDTRRDWNSVVLGHYPGAFVLTAAEIVRMYQQQGCEVMVTGHSLGGYLAEVVATSLGLCGAAFGAPGPGDHKGEYLETDFVVINHEADSIGNHNHDLHAKPPVYILDDGVLMLPWTAHRMDKMLQNMKKRQDWTNVNVLQKCVGEDQGRVPFVFPGHRSKR
eukprot:symbB.v1.2.007947.t1/scaffold493.1/size196183/9